MVEYETVALGTWVRFPAFASNIMESNFDYFNSMGDELELERIPKGIVKDPAFASTFNYVNKKRLRIK